MKYNQNRRLLRIFYAATASVTLLTGFTVWLRRRILFCRARSCAGGNSMEFADAVTEIQENAVSETKDAAEEAYRAYQKIKIEREKQPKKL